MIDEFDSAPVAVWDNAANCYQNRATRKVFINLRKIAACEPFDDEWTTVHFPTGPSRVVRMPIEEFVRCWRGRLNP